MVTMACAAAVLAAAVARGASALPSNEKLARLTSPALLPPYLSETGAFSDLTTLTPAEGVVAYDINVPFWSDGAVKRRWFCLPDPTRLVGFSRDGDWSLPTGMVWIKHFDLELTKGDPASAKRLETRLLVRTAEGVFGATYRWGESVTDAALVPERGFEEWFPIRDGTSLRSQLWRYPSRSQCLLCHTAVGGLALGFNTAQMNRPCPDGAAPRNQIGRLSAAGYFTSEVAGLPTLRALAAATNTEASIEFRFRSYLAANCAQCHQPGGKGRGYWDARITTPLSAAGLIDGPLMDDLENPANRVIIPGDLERSVLLTRLALLDYTHMPPLATSVHNTEALALLSEWITNGLARYQSLATWQQEEFGSTTVPEAAPGADPDRDGAANGLEYLTRTDPRSATDLWTFTIRATDAGVAVSFPRIANRGFEVQWTTNLADPASWRPLEVPGNRPWFFPEDRNATVEDFTADQAAKYYRVRVYEP